jgi:hypothetical protein
MDSTLFLEYNVSQLKGPCTVSLPSVYLKVLSMLRKKRAFHQIRSTPFPYSRKQESVWYLPLDSVKRKGDMVSGLPFYRPKKKWRE